MQGGKERQRNNIKVCICMSVLDGLNQSERESARKNGMRDGVLNTLKISSSKHEKCRVYLSLRYSLRCAATRDDGAPLSRKHVDLGWTWLFL